MIKFKQVNDDVAYINPHLVTYVEQRKNGVLVCFASGYVTVEEPLEKVVNAIRPWVMDAHFIKEPKQ